jgi:outer membrane receptor protein involved in Fe transport
MLPTKRFRASEAEGSPSISIRIPFLRAMSRHLLSGTRRSYVCAAALSFLLIGLFSVDAVAQTGRIAGTVTDAVTGESLPGVNVAIVGTTQGAVTNVEGYYSILNVRPGEHDIRASFIGYTPETVTGVRVSIDQTTTLDFQLGEQIFEGEEVVVTAARRVIQPDVAGSTVNISAQQIESLPVNTVAGAVGLQAGIQGLTVRGSSSDQLAFMVNGLMMRDERNNAPVTNISMASVEEVQVQTGGFNAEYGNVRSGVINVVTKEGRRDRYNVDVIARVAPAQRKHFDAPANDPNSYWVRPFIDPEVAYTGTQNWDWMTRRQYPDFEGWVSVAQNRIAEGREAMTPDALRQAFLWQHRRSFEVNEPDYELDIGFGGPVPFGQNLGNLRFYASMRREQDMYMLPLHTDRYTGQTSHVKVTSDLTTGMKLSIEGMLGDNRATSASAAGAPGIFRSPSGIASNISRLSFIDTRLFATDYWAPTEINRNMLGARFTHVLNPETFYEIRALRMETAYDTNPGPYRDTTNVVNIGGVWFDAAPFGFYPFQSTGVDGMRMGVGMSTARDTSRTVMWNVKGDLTRQMNRYLQIKTGAEFNVTENRINYGRFDQVLQSANQHSQWETFPIRGALYGQSRLEFQGMIANIGLRLDYSHAGGTWYEFDDWTLAFAEQFAGGIDTLLNEVSTSHILSLSPRVGVSFPITENSKLFFNYGHFRSMPTADDLYMIRRESFTGAINRVADPNSPLPRTVAYELGYEHALFDQFLVRVAGYYRDVSLQPYLVTYTSRLQAGGIQSVYSVTNPFSYEDIRGFEFTLGRNVGRWVQGFVNYTYMVRTFGHFGSAQMYQNPTQQAQWERENQPWRAAQQRPVAQPFARVNLDVLVPRDFGPRVGETPVLGDWRLSFLGSWQMGSLLTWPSGSLNQMRFRDYYNLDLRLARNFQVANRRVSVFADMTNALNIRRLTFNGFVDGVDQNRYLESLHLPEHPDLQNIPGNDKPGYFRKPGVAWQPMFPIGSRTEFTGNNQPLPGAFYWERSTGEWLEYVDSQWRQADQGRVNQALDDRAYIEMPNQGWQTFLDPRQVFFGIRLTL